MLSELTTVNGGVPLDTTTCNFMIHVKVLDLDESNLTTLDHIGKLKYYKMKTTNFITYSPERRDINHEVRLKYQYVSKYESREN